MQIVQEAIWLTIYQSYGLGVEAVQGPVGSRLGASVPLVYAVCVCIGAADPQRDTHQFDLTRHHRAPGFHGNKSD